MTSREIIRRVLEFDNPPRIGFTYSDYDGQPRLRDTVGMGPQPDPNFEEKRWLDDDGGEQWTDYSFEADAYAENGHFGLWVRADMQDEESGNGRWVQGYYFVVSHNKCRLWRARQDGLVLRNEAGEQLQPEQNHFSNPILLTEDEVPTSVARGRWLRLRVGVCGSRITCFVDNRQVLSAVDDLYPSGTVGLTVYKGEDVRFDNIRVVSLPSHEDSP